MQYAINSAAAIYDIIDGDIVIIHLENGNYYNLSDSGALIWQRIANNTAFDHLLVILAATYDVDTATIEQDLQVFLAQLEAEGLLLRRPQIEATIPERNIPAPENERLDYLPPALDKFTDMQDFLLVDPIHEVDEQGLPKYTPPQTDDD